uniref:Uncharacterized protein n=1 Tax=Rhizophora mucronata TaxID=61149 RepID=A0A2P2Q8D8_RHIMU
MTSINPISRKYRNAMNASIIIWMIDTASNSKQTTHPKPQNDH